MNIRTKFATLLTAAIFCTVTTEAQNSNDNFLFTHDVGKKKQVYFGNNYEGALISTAIQNNSLGNPSLGTPRFTYFFHLGFNMHVDLSNTIGLYTGLGIKNIGFIEKTNSVNALTGVVRDSTIKRRVYTVGLPIGIKIGNMKRRNFAVVGGGIDLPFNYREKGFVKRGDKDKFNEWFSDRTARFMPYVFAGISVDPGIVFKVQYYPTNFMNPDYTTQNSNLVILPVALTRPYANYDVNLLLFSIGFDIHYKSNTKTFKKKKKDAVGTM